MQAATFSVVSHGHGTLLRALLGDMNRAPALKGARVIVTLNLPDEPFESTPFPNLDIEVLKNSRPLGFGANHNQAFLRCRTPWFVILNPDLRFADTEPFTALLDHGGRHARTALVAPQVVSSSGAPEDSVRANLTPWSLIERHLLGRRRPLPASQPACLGQPFFWVAGMCLCMNSEAFAAVGGFDERYFLYCEDCDLCARLYIAGYALEFDRSVRVVHDAQRDSHRSLKHLRWHLASLAKYWMSKGFWKIVFAPLTHKKRGTSLR